MRVAAHTRMRERASQPSVCQDNTIANGNLAACGSAEQGGAVGKTANEMVLCWHAGASGVTGMFKDPKGGPDVAVKMMKRPLPKPSIPSVLREITVRRC